MTHQEALEARGVFIQIKEASKLYKVAMPEIVARCVEHALTSDGFDMADLVSDAPRSSRGRKALDPAVKAAREALAKVAKGGDLSALQAAIDGLTRGVSA